MVDEIDKLEFIAKTLGVKKFDEKNLFVSALVGCLSPETMCNVVKAKEIDRRLKEHILRKIHKDIESKKFLSVYEPFVEGLMNEFYVQYNFAYVLDRLYRALSCSFRKEILALFSNSRYLSTRSRAYRIIREAWSNNYFEIVSNYVGWV